VANLADRSTSVALTLQAGQFKAEAAAVKKAIDDVDDKVEALDRGLKKISPDAVKAAAAMKLLSSSSAELGNNISQIGDKATALQVLDRRIATSRSEVRKLADEFLKTGDLDVFKKLGDSEGELGKLSGIRKALVAELKGGAEEGAKVAGGTFAQVFQGGITSAFQSLPGPAKAALIAALAVAAVGASAVIVEIISTALLAGVGAAGLGTAIAFAVQDEHVARAFTALGDHAQAALKDAASPFRAELIDSAAIFTKSFDATMPRIKAGLASLAPETSKLAANVGKAFENMGPGLEKALKASGPLLDSLGSGLATAGKAFGQLLSTIAYHGEGANMVMKLIVANITVLIQFITAAVDVAGAFFDILAKVAKAGAAVWGWITGAKPKEAKDGLDGVGEGGQNAAKGLDQASDSAGALSHAMSPVIGGAEDMADAFDRLFNETMGLDQANLAVKQGLADLKKELGDGKRTLDTNTQAGRDNVQGILEQIDALNRQREAQIAAGNGTAAATAEANAAYYRNIAALRALLVQMGFNAAEVDVFIGKWMQAAGMPDITHTITTRYINEYINKSFTENYGSMADAREGFRTGANSKKARGGIRKAATGLVIPPSSPGTTLVGEPQTGGEVLIPMRGIGQSRAMSLMRTVGAGYGLDVAPRWQSGGAWTGPRASGPVGSSAVDPRALGVAVRQALAGMAVVLDGQRVGYVQGRSADLMRRGG
jgi:hypothetical protein